MNATLSLLRRIRNKCPDVDGLKPEISISTDEDEGLTITAMWHSEDGFGVDTYYPLDKVAKTDEEVLISSFISHCEKHAKKKYG